MLEKPNTASEVALYNVDPIAAQLKEQIPFVTPNQRLASRVLKAWNTSQANCGLITWETSDIASVEHWFSRCWQQYSWDGGRPYINKSVLTPRIAQQLWQRCIRESPKGELLLKIAATAQQAASAYRTIKLWRLDTTSPEVKQRFAMDDDCAEYLAWLENFEKVCEKEGFISPEKCIEIMLKDDNYPLISSLVLLEFEDVPPLYRDFFDSKVSLLHEHHDRERQAQCQALACDDEEDEIYSAAHWIKSVLKRDSEANFAFIHPQLAQQRTRVERIFNEVLNPSVISVDEQRLISPFNFSAGMALAECSPIRAALGFLKLLLPEIETETAIFCMTTRYGGSGLDELNGRVATIKALHDMGMESLTSSNLRQVLQNSPWWNDENQEHKGIALGRQLLKLSQNRQYRIEALPSVWAKLAGNALASMGWPGAAVLDSVEYQQIEHWYRVLEELESLDDIALTLSLSDFLKLLQQLLTETIFQPKTPDSNIQILGQLEGAGLQFTHIWVAGMGHLDWPPAAAPNPFIPVSIQRAMAMPHSDAERELHFCNQLLDRYRYSADYLCLSFVGIRDGIVQKLSGLVADTPVVDKEQLFGYSPGKPYLHYWRVLRQSMNFYEELDVQGPVLAEEEQTRGGSGLIEDQSACAFRAFAKHRLAAVKLNDLQPALNAMDRGILLHDALFRLWSQIESSDGLAGINDQQLEVIIGNSVGPAIVDFLKKNSFQYGEKYLRVEKRRLCLLLAEWMILERKREQFKVVASEQGSQFELGPLRISLRIDRVDELEDGSKLLIDYKSGHCDIKHWFGERLEKPQLPLYATVEGADIGGIAYARVKTGETSYIGLSAENSFDAVLSCDDDKALQKKKLDWDGNWEELQSHWQLQLNNLSQEFIDGRATVDPSRGDETCRYCDLASLCRKHEVLQ